MRPLYLPHYNPSGERSFSKTSFKPEESLETGANFSILCGRKHVKTELSKNGVVMIIMWIPRASFNQTQIQKDRWLLRFQPLRRSVDKMNIWYFIGVKTAFFWITRWPGRKNEFTERQWSVHYDNMHTNINGINEKLAPWKKWNWSTDTPNVWKIALKSSSFLSEMPAEADVSVFYQ